MLSISPRVHIPLDEVEITQIRAQGSGGQHINKVSCAVHLRFDIRASSLPETYKERLLALKDHRISSDGVVVLKAQEYRSLDRNRDAALARLANLIRSVGTTPKKRLPTKPTRASRERRMEEKKKRGRTKSLRGGVED